MYQYLSRQYDVFDFRISNVLGEDMLTFLYPRNRSAVLLDLSYNIRATVPVADGHKKVDMHELHFVDNGTRALFFYDQARNASEEVARAIGYHGGDCLINDNLFQELDVAKSFNPIFTWSAAEHIGLYESSEVQDSLQQRCKHVSTSREQGICIFAETAPALGLPPRQLLGQISRRQLSHVFSPHRHHI